MLARHKVKFFALSIGWLVNILPRAFTVVVCIKVTPASLVGVKTRCHFFLLVGKATMVIDMWRIRSMPRRFKVAANC